VTKVYVPNNWKHSATDAEQFGQLVYLTTGPVRRTQVRQLMGQIRAGLESSGPDDFVVIGALSVLSSLACAAFAAKHGRLNMLLWDNGHYVQRHVSSVA
jgi:hypothetical protein